MDVLTSPAGFRHQPGVLANDSFDDIEHLQHQQGHQRLKRPEGHRGRRSWGFPASTDNLGMLFYCIYDINWLCIIRLAFYFSLPATFSVLFLLFHVALYPRLPSPPSVCRFQALRSWVILFEARWTPWLVIDCSPSTLLLHTFLYPSVFAFTEPSCFIPSLLISSDALSPSCPYPSVIPFLGLGITLLETLPFFVLVSLTVDPSSS